MSRQRKGVVQPIKSAMRTLELLEYFRKRQAPANAAEIAAALHMPQSSTSVLLKSLVSLNYLDYDPAIRRFLPSYRVALLGDWIQRARFGDERITNIMEALGADTGETVMLGQQTGAGMQYLHVVLATLGIQVLIQSGEIRPMSRCALGQILLSHKPNSEIRAIIRRNNADEPDPTQRIGEPAFIKEIESIRRCGFSESRGRMTSGSNTIGMILPSASPGPLLAIGIGGPSQRIDAKREYIIEAMRHRLGLSSEL